MNPPLVVLVAEQEQSSKIETKRKHDVISFLSYQEKCFDA